MIEIYDIALTALLKVLFLFTNYVVVKIFLMHPVFNNYLTKFRLFDINEKNIYILHFKLSPCSECCVLFSG